MAVEDKDFFRYQLKHTFGVISSANCNVLQEDKHAIVGALDEIKIWNLRTGALDKRIVENSDSNHSQVTCLAINPSNRDIIAAGYDDGSIKLWNLKDSRLVVQFNGHRTAVTAISFDPYTMKMASGGRDSDIVVWDLVAEAGLFRLQGHTGGISVIRFIRSGQFIVSAGRDGWVKVWDVDAQLAVETEVSHRNEILDLTISSDEQIMFTVGADQVIRIFSIDHQVLPLLLKQDGEKRTALSLQGEVLRGTKERALQITLHPNHRIIAVLSADRSLEFFEVRGKEEAKVKLRRKKKNIGSEAANVQLTAVDLFKQLRVCKLSSRAHSFALSSMDSKSNSVKALIGYNNNRLEELLIPLDPLQSFTINASIDQIGHRSEIKSLAINPDQTLLASGGPDGCKVWSVEEGQYLRTVGTDNGDDVLEVSSVSFLNLNTLLLGTKKGLLILANAQTGEVIEAYKAHEGNLWSVDVGSDGRTIATASSDKTVKIWEVKQKKEGSIKLKCLKTLDLGDEALVVKLSHDLRLVAVACLDMSVKVFFVDTLKLFLTLFGHKLPVTSIDIGRDCKTIITGSLDKSVKIWGLEFGELKKSLLAHTEAVTQVRFLDSDSSSFVSVGKDRVVKTWKASGSFHPLQRHFDGQSFGEVWALAVSPSFIAIAGHDRMIKVYQLGDELLLPEEEAEREADRRLEQSVIESEEQTAEPSKLTVESMKASERILKVIEEADDERQGRDESMANQTSHEPTLIFKTIARNMEPFEYVMKQLDVIPAPDLDQSIILLPQRLIFSLLFYIEKSIETPYLATACNVFNAVMRLFYNEISVDRQLHGILDSIRTKMRHNLSLLDQTYMFNYAAMSNLSITN